MTTIAIWTGFKWMDGHFEKNQINGLRAKIAQYYGPVVDGVELLSTLETNTQDIPK